MIVIGDVAGRYEETMLLIKQMNVTDLSKLIFVGDVIDRGSKSCQMIEWLIKNKVKCLLGNHEHMMWDYYNGEKIYDKGLWFINGGQATVKSYEKSPDLIKPHLQWIRNLPLYYSDNEIIVSHAPLLLEPTYDMKYLFDKDFANLGRSEDSFIWNRRLPVARQKLQIFGHNGKYGAILDSYKTIAICVDDTHHENVCAYDTEEKKLYFHSFNDI